MSADIQKFAATHDVPIWWESDRTRHLITRLDSGSPIEAWQQAGIGYDIVTLPDGTLPPIYDYEPDTGIYKPKTEFRQILRDDNRGVLGVVSSHYKLHSVAEFCDAARRVEERSGYLMKTCGTLAGGRKIFFMLETEKEKNIAGEAFNRNVVIGTSFDGKQSSFAICTDVAVVCQNTLALALATGSNHVKLTHKQGFSEDYLIGSLENLGEQQRRNESIIEQLVNVTVSNDEMVGYFDNVTRLMTQPEKVRKSKDKRDFEEWKRGQVTQMVDSYLNGPGGVNDRDCVDSRVGTMHGATQAIYHFVDHKLLKTQAGGYKARYNERRLGLQGGENAIKTGALGIALEGLKVAA